MNTVSALQESDVRIASGRSHAEEPNDSSRATFQDAVDARREERARSASKKEDEASENPRTEDVGDGREEVREKAPEETREEPTEQSKTEPRERRSDARDTRDSAAESTPHEGESTRRGTPRGLKGTARSSAKSGDAVGGTLDPSGLAKTALDARFSLALPNTASSTSTAVASAPGQGESPAGSVVGAEAAPAPSSEISVAPQGAVSPSGTPAAGLEAGASAASPPAVEALATLHAARAAGSGAVTVDPRGASGASGATQAGETAASREPLAPRMSPAELPAFLDKLAVHVDAPQRSAVVELDPAELGRVSISLSLDREGHVRADVHTQRPEGYAALEARLPELRASLIQRGFESASVSLSLGMPDSRSQRSGAEGGRGSSSQHRGRTLARAEIQALLPNTPTRPGAVDLWA